MIRPPSGSTSIDRRRTPEPTRQPLITRRSTIVSSVAAILALVLYQTMVSSSGVPSDRALAAVVEGILVVTALIAWVSGLVLAARFGSFLWMLVVVLAGPLGSLACALIGPPRGSSAPPPPGSAR